VYYVEMNCNNDLGWRRVPFAEHRTRAYCDGYVDAHDSMYPSRPMRIIQEKDGTTKVIRETKGHSKVHVN